MIGLLFAIVAIVTSPQPVPADFAADVLGHCHPHNEPGVFVGCEGAPSDDDSSYAGVIWIDGAATLQTGP